MVGPLLGGWIYDTFTASWAFRANALMLGLGAALILLLIRRPAAPTARLLACKMAMNESNLLPALLRGFILGLAIAAPVGPIGVLCIRRTLAMGRLFGFVSGLGAATADAICTAASPHSA